MGGGGGHRPKGRSLTGKAPPTAVTPVQRSRGAGPGATALSANTAVPSGRARAEDPAPGLAGGWATPSGRTTAAPVAPAAQDGPLETTVLGQGHGPLRLLWRVATTETRSRGGAGGQAGAPGAGAGGRAGGGQEPVRRNLLGQDQEPACWCLCQGRPEGGRAAGRCWLRARGIHSRDGASSTAAGLQGGRGGSHGLLGAHSRQLPGPRARFPGPGSKPEHIPASGAQGLSIDL